MSCTGHCIRTAIQKTAKCEIPPKKHFRWGPFKEVRLQLMIFFKSTINLLIVFQINWSVFSSVKCQKVEQCWYPFPPQTSCFVHNLKIFISLSYRTNKLEKKSHLRSWSHVRTLLKKNNNKEMTQNDQSCQSTGWSASSLSISQFPFSIMCVYVYELHWFLLYEALCVTFCMYEKCYTKKVMDWLI